MSQLAKSGQQGSQYTDVHRREVLSHYLVLGNIPKVSQITGIPDRTIYEWKQKSEWWEPELARIREQKSEELDATYTNIIHEVQAQVLDRVQNGDFILDKQRVVDEDGNTTVEHVQVRKPMTGKDLTMVGAIQFDKRQISRNLPTSISAGIDNKALQDLKQRFEALANKETKTITGDCEDITPS